MVTAHMPVYRDLFNALPDMDCRRRRTVRQMGLFPPTLVQVGRSKVGYTRDRASRALHTPDGTNLMPRRNILVLLVVSVISLLCYRKIQTNVHGRILANVLQQIEQTAYEDIAAEKLLEGAIEGMVAKLNDRYAAYLPPKPFKELSQELDQKFGGVGMSFGFDKRINQLVVLSPIFGSPAHKAGIRAGDRILRIDGHNTQGMSRNDAGNRMRGAQGEPVVLTVVHEGSKKEVEIEIVRAIVELETVVGDTRDAEGAWNFLLEGHKGVAYVRIDGGFGERTPTELRTVLGKLLDRNVRGLVLDLRDNPGGLLRRAVEVCDLFVDQGVIVTTRDRNGQILDEYRAGSRGTFRNLPVAVLVNEDTASASEIVAACLQDHRRAVVVGVRSYGKGTVQHMIELEGNRGAIKLTSSTYWRPSGKNINRRSISKDDPENGSEDNSESESENSDWGVSPNKGYEVVLDIEEREQFRLWRDQRDFHYQIVRGDRPDGEPPEPFVDRQLAKAVETVEKAMAKGP